MGESLEVPPPAAPTYRDRSTGLLLFGLLELVIALFALGFAGVMIVLMLSPVMQEARAQVYSQSNPGAFALSFLVYPLIAVFFGTMGVGTLLGRRWARAIMLVVSWLWLAVGIITTLAMVFFLPRMMQAAMAAGPASQVKGAQEMGTCATVIGGVVLFLFYVLLPLGFLLFYRSPHVKATVEAKDPKERWTDRCPLPVLGAALVAGYGAFASLCGLAYGVFPIAGHLLRGLPALLIFLGMAAVNAALAVGLYRLRPAAWWGAVAFYSASVLVTLMTFGRGVPWREMYTAMGTPPAQVEMMEKSGILAALEGPTFLIPAVLLFLGVIGYLFWIRRYFRG